MYKRFPKTTLRRSARLQLVAACCLLCLLPTAIAQRRGNGGVDPLHGEASQIGRAADKASQPPTLSIDVAPLGFSAPGANYMGQRATLASLDFLDENRLLFTFRVPGLIRRDPASGSESDERRIRAVVLSLPEGRVEAEALWTLHDRSRYLWMLKDGHFLLRDQSSLMQGDATLALTPRLRFPGPLVSVEIDPSQEYIVTGSTEPLTGPDGRSSPDQAGKPEVVLRILRRETGQVLRVSRVLTALHLPIDSEGYLESLRGKGTEWQLRMNYFTSGSSMLGSLNSSCPPTFDFLSQAELLAFVCTAQGGHRLEALGAAGRPLWQAQLPDWDYWPVLVRSAGGARFAWEALTVAREANPTSRLTTEDVRGQEVEVFDAADGHPALSAPVAPPLDAGGNVAISPTGRRVAVLNAGALQIYDLPEPPAPPRIDGNQQGH
jgi:hypothetical protein